MTALLVSLINLSLSCYPDRLEYVDQVLHFAKTKVQEFSDNPDLHHPATTQSLLSLLLAPVQSYVTPLTLLALPSYVELISVQPYSTRRSIAHALVSAILKTETVIDTPEDVKGVLDLCHVLVRDQKDMSAPVHPAMSRSRSQQGYDQAAMAQEQGWIARMVHLFRSDSLDVQLKLLQTARKEFAEGGERVRWTFPSLIVGAIKLARRYKYRESAIVDWDEKIAIVFKFIHSSTAFLYNKVESSESCLRLYLLALSSADECGLEELAYEFAVEAFTIYEDSISESRAQLQAITLIIGTLQTTQVFSEDNYDTLITKAALHGAKLLKKGQQATAVALASHMWWQSDRREGAPLRDGKRVLECLQKSLRIATSSIDELTSVQLYCDALDQYLYYFERQVEAISAKHINSLIELISSSLDQLPQQSSGPTDFPSNAGGATAGLIEGINTVEAVQRHFRNTLLYIHSRKQGAGLQPHAIAGAAPQSANEETGEALRELFNDVDVAGPLLKYGGGSS